MPDNDARDSYIELELELPNGAPITGHLIGFRTGLTLKALLYKFSETLEQEDFNKLWAKFEEATGITEAALIEKLGKLPSGEPKITMLELTDLISRFIYALRPGRTAARLGTMTPGSTVAPAAPASAVLTGA
jgi:hypothetical protein